MDRARWPIDDGAGPAEAVVVDTTTGEEVVRSSEGLVPSKTEGADWTDLYEDAPVAMLGVVDETAYVAGLDQLVTFDLATGASTSEDLDWSAIRSAEWFQSFHRTPPLWNADRSWAIPAQEFGATPVLESADGERVTTSVPDPTGPLGSPSRDGFDVDWTTPVLLTCTVPTGECTVMGGTEEGVNLPANRPFGLPRESSIDPG